MSRRQRKNLGESLNKATRSIPQREKELILKDKNFLTSITDLCKSESNLNLLSSKISSILNCNLKELNKKNLSNVNTESMNTDDAEHHYQENEEFGENMSACEMDTKIRVGKKQKHEDSMLNDSISGNDTNDMENDDDDEDDGDDSERNSFKAPINRRALMENSQLAITSNPRFKDFLLQTSSNLVISKGSKKWISDSVSQMNDLVDDSSLITQANRDFLAKFISSKLHKGNSLQKCGSDNAMNERQCSENSPILDVSDPNLHQQQQQENNHFNQVFQQNSMGQSSTSMMEMHSQFQNNGNSGSNQNVFNTHFNPLGGFYNGNSNGSRNMNSSIPTSASLLVEAALSSVGNMIGNNDQSHQQIAMNDGEVHQQDLPDEMNNSEYQESHNMMSSVDENLKIMKTHNFPIHLPPMASFNSGVSANMISENNDTDVDAPPNSKSHEKLCTYTPSSDKEVNISSFQNQPSDSCSPRTITPDQHNPNYSNSQYSNQRNLQVSQIQRSPGQLSSRPIYGSEHDLVSPASTPSLPRYDFGAENYRRREKTLDSHPQVEYQKSIQSQQQQISHISSDEENSIVIAENLSLSQQTQNRIDNEKIKLSSQIDLLYSNNGKYENSGNNSLSQINRESSNDLRLKYNENGLEIHEFSRNSVVSDMNSGNGPDFQGLDMSSR